MWSIRRKGLGFGDLSQFEIKEISFLFVNQNLIILGKLRGEHTEFIRDSDKSQVRKLWG